MAKIQRSTMTMTDAQGKVLRAPKDNASEVVNFRWWDLPENQMASAIASTLRFIQRHQGARIEQLTVSTRLYGSVSVYNLLGSAFTRAASINSNPAVQRMSYNVVESIIDTLQAKMAKNDVIPTFITNGGDWEIQKQAKELTKFAQGLCYENKMADLSLDTFRDAAVWGDGFLQIYEKDDKVCWERTYPHELFVDNVQALTSAPSQLHRVKIMDRDIALELLPELEENIMTVSPANYQEIGGAGTAVDLITVTESWHLKSGPEAKDGVHAFAVGDGCIAEEYEKDYFPFSHLRYVPRLLGWYGQGVAERIQNIQGEINRSMVLKQRSMWMQGSFKILVPIGSKIVAQHLNNDIGAIINYSGEAPQYIAPPATNPELQQWIDALIAYAMAQEGISRMTTTGEVPLGVESGKAMRTLVQVSDDRFKVLSKYMENFVLDTIKQSINIVKEIYERTNTYKVIFPNTRFIETIEWGDIQIEESQYTLKAFPTSSLSDDLTGRLSEVQELIKAGMVSPRSGRRLLDMPDVEANDALSNAPEDRLHQIFEKMLKDKEVTRFEAAYHDSNLARQLGLEYINYAEYMNIPDENIQLIRDFLNDVNAETGPQPGIVPQSLALGQPQANPQAPPQSNLIPNVPGVQA